MKLIKIGISNVDTTVGAFGANVEKMIGSAKALAEDNCTIGAFPEQTISGYPSEDLIQWKGYVEGQWAALERFVEKTSKLPTVFVLGITIEKSGELYNCAAITGQGNIYGLVPKEKLPTYNVFYEQRTFSSGYSGMEEEINGVPFGDFIFKFPFGTLALEICEDIWSPDGPMRRRAFSGADIIVNVSSSPWRAGILNTRREVVATRASDNLATVIYANQIGVNDSLVFDGGGFVNQCGKMLFEAPRWREGHATAVVDLDRTSQARHENTTWRMDRKSFLTANKKVNTIECEWKAAKGSKNIKYPHEPSKSFFGAYGKIEDARELYFQDLVEAMVAGLKGYFEKTGVFERIGIALSGGKDSALSLLIVRIYAERRFAHLKEEQKRERIQDLIHCFSMPTSFNSEETKTIARELAEECGAAFVEVPIKEQFQKQKKLLDNMLYQNEIPSVAMQNMQARVRGSAMWNWSNAASGMWIQTGNMSEKAVGYTTIGGDMMGAYSLIGNLPKTVVSELIEYLHKNKFSEFASLPKLMATKASAELSNDQEDEEDLMPFSILDACYALFVGEKMMPYEVYKALCDIYPDHSEKDLRKWVKKFTQKFRASIFKWVQAPQTVHLGSLDLDRERALQLPVVQSDGWLLFDKLE